MEADFTHRFKQPEPLAEGGYGQVFKAVDPRLERQVAIKVMHREMLKEENGSERFLREARSTGVLEHPNIPPIYEYGETDSGRPFFALKLIEGETLADVISRLKEGDAQTHQDYPFSRRTQIAIDVCNALEYAHDREIVHRDIKSENIMLGRFGEVWLVDWGLAAPPSEDTAPDDRLTEEYAFVGTLSYASPEQVAGVYSKTSDQYSLGVVMYELFALRSPYESAKSRYEKMTALLHTKPEAAESFVDPVQGRVPRETSVLIARMLEKKAEDRFKSISEVKQELETILGGDIRAICPHTFMKKKMHGFGRLLDNHNRWLAPLLILWLSYPIVHLIYWAVGKATGP